MHKVDLPSYAVERGLLMHPPRALVPSQTAVVAIDFQRFFIDEGQPMGNPHARDILANANRLHGAVRAAGGLVVFTQHSIGPPEARADAGESTLLPGSGSYDLHPDLVVDDRDLRIVKRQSSPLHPKADTALESELRARGVDTVIVSGLVTNGCCDCTARDAFQHGFNVIVVSDATAAMTDAEHNAALLNLEIYYARVLSTSELVQALGS
ncbi:MAG: cysteine hydrolase [Gammaproteobacteria bacterium]|jgi:nicotinamidase-related amidase|nr:cysteine hydrolase [Gammaproteobacteria bacterium]